MREGIIIGIDSDWLTKTCVFVTCVQRNRGKAQPHEKQTSLYSDGTHKAGRIVMKVSGKRSFLFTSSGGYHIYLVYLLNRSYESKFFSPLKRHMLTKTKKSLYLL